MNIRKIPFAPPPPRVFSKISLGTRAKHAWLDRKLSKIARTRSFAFHTFTRRRECWRARARAPFVHAVCQCAGLDSRGFNTRYRGDCCSLSACSTQPNDRLSSHRGAQPPFVRATMSLGPLFHARGTDFKLGTPRIEGRWDRFERFSSLFE